MGAAVWRRLFGPGIRGTRGERRRKDSGTRPAAAAKPQIPGGVHEPRFTAGDRESIVSSETAAPARPTPATNGTGAASRRAEARGSDSRMSVDTEVQGDAKHVGHVAL